MQTIIKKIFFVNCIEIINLSLHELGLIAISRGIKDYKNKFKDGLMKMLSKPEPKLKIEKIRKKINESSDRFSKSKIKEIRKKFYEIENKNNRFTLKINRLKKIFSN